MTTQIPFDKSFVIQETKRHMLKCLAFSEMKTVNRFGDLGDEKSQEAFQTCMYLTSIKELIEAIPGNGDARLLKKAIDAFKSSL